MWQRGCEGSNTLDVAASSAHFRPLGVRTPGGPASFLSGRCLVLEGLWEIPLDISSLQRCSQQCTPGAAWQWGMDEWTRVPSVSRYHRASPTSVTHHFAMEIAHLMSAQRETLTVVAPKAGGLKSPEFEESWSCKERASCQASSEISPTYPSQQFS